MVYACIITVILITYWGQTTNLLTTVLSDLSKKQRVILFFSIANVLFVWILFISLYIYKPEIDTNIGQIGDFIGGLLNPILSFMALIAILMSIGVQEKELSSSVSALKSQEDVFKIQTFENSFFNLLNLHRQRRTELIEIGTDGKVIKQLERTAKNIRKYRKSLDSQKNLSPLQRHRFARKFIKKRLSTISCGVIYRQFLTIREVISNAKLSKQQEKFYYSLAYNDFNSYERAVLCNYVLVKRITRKILRKYKLTAVKDEWLISPFLHKYYHP